MAIQIIKQNDGINTDQPKYRVEIKDNGGYGLGYGDTPRRAYAEARDDYEQYRAADTERFLDESLSQFERELNDTRHQMRMNYRMNLNAINAIRRT